MYAHLSIKPLLTKPIRIIINTRIRERMMSMSDFLMVIFMSFLPPEAQYFCRGVFRLVWQRVRAVNRPTCNYLWVYEPLSLSSDYCVNHLTKAPVINASLSHRLAEGKQNTQAGSLRGLIRMMPLYPQISRQVLSWVIAVYKLVSLTSMSRCTICVLFQKKRLPPPPRCHLAEVFFSSPSQGKLESPLSHRQYVV